MLKEWTALPSGEELHKTTVKARIQQHRWTARDALSTPVRPKRWLDGRLNIAAAARADHLHPTKVQVMMRKFNASYETVRDYVRQHGYAFA